MNRAMPILAFLLTLGLIACLVGFAAIVIVDRYHRSHPPIDMPLPKTIDDVKLPPTMTRSWNCGIDGIVQSYDNPDRTQCVPYDPKG